MPPKFLETAYENDTRAKEGGPYIEFKAKAAPVSGRGYSVVSPKSRSEAQNISAKLLLK